MKKLNQHDFVIYERNKDCPEPPAPINEYIYCRNDILLYHESSVEFHLESLEALHVSLESLSIDNQNDLPVNDIDLKAGVTELKVKGIDASAENECYFNMFGEAAKLVASVLWEACP